MYATIDYKNLRSEERMRKKDEVMKGSFCISPRIFPF
jgi:hypothetical protein